MMYNTVGFSQALITAFVLVSVHFTPCLPCLPFLGRHFPAFSWWLNASHLNCAKFPHHSSRWFCFGHVAAPSAALTQCVCCSSYEKHTRTFPFCVHEKAGFPKRYALYPHPKLPAWKALQFDVGASGARAFPLPPRCWQVCPGARNHHHQDLAAGKPFTPISPTTLPCG